MTGEEYNHINDVMQDLYSSGKLSEQDFDFICECIDKADRIDKYKWIPVTAKEITEEERIEIYCDAHEDISHVFTCQLPDDGDEILISQNNGKWVSATVFCNDDYGVGDEEGNDWLYEVDAWMPMPKGYVKSEKGKRLNK